MLLVINLSVTNIEAPGNMGSCTVDSSRESRTELWAAHERDYF
jgi:hypothetical protein